MGETDQKSIWNIEHFHPIPEFLNEETQFIIINKRWKRIKQIRAFLVQQETLEFFSLCFGLYVAPPILTKILKVPIFVSWRLEINKGTINE